MVTLPSDPSADFEIGLPLEASDPPARSNRVVLSASRITITEISYRARYVKIEKIVHYRLLRLRALVYARCGKTIKLVFVGRTKK